MDLFLYKLHGKSFLFYLRIQQYISTKCKNLIQITHLINVFLTGTFFSYKFSLFFKKNVNDRINKFHAENGNKINSLQIFVHISCIFPLLYTTDSKKKKKKNVNIFHKIYTFYEVVLLFETCYIIVTINNMRLLSQLKRLEIPALQVKRNISKFNI